MARKRVLRVIEYEGDEEWVDETIGKSIVGELDCGHKGTIRAFSCTMQSAKEFESELNWFAKFIGFEESFSDVLKDLDNNAATGLDMSPGCNLSHRAAQLIRRLMAKRS